MEESIQILGRPQKKNPPLMARPIRGGGGVQTGPLRKKLIFLKIINFFFFQLKKYKF
jgi:hypothetical protein